MSIKASILRKIYWVNDFLHGSPVRSQYRDIRKKQTDTASIGKSLAELLEYATGHCEFYRAYRGKRLADFPVVNKNIIRENMDGIRVPEERNPWQKAGTGYFTKKTSGSTGTPFTVEQDTRKRHRLIAELKYSGELLGFRSHDELVHVRIWTREQLEDKTPRERDNIYRFNGANLNDEQLGGLCRLVEQSKAKCLRGFSTSFELLAQYMLRHGKTLPTVRLIIAGGGALYDSTREAVEQVMPGCHIVSQYANEECGIMAQERRGEPGVFHLNRSSYIFEVLKPDCDEPAADGELGRIVVTDMYNYACPLIRYDTGDMCVQRHDEHGVPYFEKLYGRRLDVLYDTSGAPVYPVIFGSKLKHFDRIVQWQLIQRGEREYLLRLALEGEGEFHEAGRVLDAMRQLLGADAEIDLEYTGKIPVLSSGKRKCLINEWKQS